MGFLLIAVPLQDPVPAGGHLPAGTYIIVSIVTLWVPLSLQVVICRQALELL